MGNLQLNTLPINLLSIPFPSFPLFPPLYLTQISNVLTEFCPPERDAAELFS